MQSGRLERCAGLATGHFHHDLAFEIAQRVGGGHRGLTVDPEIDLLPACRKLAPQRRKALIGVDYRRALRLEILVEFALGAGDRFFGREERHMGASGVVDERYIGRGEPRQIADFASVIHAHLDHRETVIGLQLQQHERHTDVVVEVAARGQNAGFSIDD